MLRRPAGYFIGVFPEGSPLERDSAQCKHCQRIILIEPGCSPLDLPPVCMVCHGMMCPRCYHKRTVLLEPCATWERQMEVMERRERFLASAGIRE